MHNTYGVLPVSNCNKNSIIPKMRLEDIIEVYFDMSKGVNGYRQALSIVRELSSEWNKYVEFDRHRCCLVARDRNRNRIIKKFNLK